MLHMPHDGRSVILPLQDEHTWVTWRHDQHLGSYFPTDMCPACKRHMLATGTPAALSPSMTRRCAGNMPGTCSRNAGEAWGWRPVTNGEDEQYTGAAVEGSVSARYSSCMIRSSGVQSKQPWLVSLD